MLGSPKWQSFWDLANPQRAAAVLLELYGETAVAEAAGCAAAARSDKRDDDYRFWIAVQARLQAAQRNTAGPNRPPRKDPANPPAVST